MEKRSVGMTIRYEQEPDNISHYGKTCCKYGCKETCPDHKFGMIRANTEGWFFTGEGLAYCPEHVPVWVAAWRRKKAPESAAEGL